MARFLKLRRDNSEDIIYVNPEFIVSIEGVPNYTVLSMSDGQYKVITVAETPNQIFDMIGAVRQA
jgi:uncharacterized protein YlzI (FlbEa/FlbD family)